jgi:hypothetical protein
LKTLYEQVRVKAEEADAMNPLERSDATSDESMSSPSLTSVSSFRELRALDVMKPIMILTGQ